jgi:hypothetical protein
MKDLALLRSPPSDRVTVLCADGERWGALVEDEGDGFDPSDIPDPDDLRTVLSETGRGIRLMDGYLDELLYNQKGNRLLMIRRRQAQPETSEAPAVVEGEQPAAPAAASAGRQAQQEHCDDSAVGARTVQAALIGSRPPSTRRLVSCWASICIFK